MADDLSVTLLRGLLPDLYRKAQAGDDAATDRIISIMRQLDKLEQRTKPLDETPVAEGFTAPPNAPGQAQSHESKTALDAWLAEQSTAPSWLEMYHDLLAERNPDTKRPRWDWRKALYIAWSATPHDKRWPRTRNDLAKFLGLTDAATMRHWRMKDQEIDERIQALPRQVLLEHVATVFDAMVTVASQPDARSFQDRQLFLKITGHYQPSKTVELGGQLDVKGFVSFSPDDWDQDPPDSNV